MFRTPIAQIGVVILALVCAFVFWRGGRKERWAALIYAAGWVGAAAVQNRGNYDAPQYGVLLIDLLVLLGFLWIAFGSKRIWASCAAGFQLANTLIDVAVLLDIRIMARTFVTASYIFAYLVLVALVAGALTARRDPPQARGSGLSG